MKNCTKPAVRLLLAVALTGLIASPVAAKVGGISQSGKPTTDVARDADLDPAPVASLGTELNQAEADLDAIALRAHSRGLSDTDLRIQAEAVPPIQARLANALDALTPRLQTADNRLAQLGPPPGGGQPAEAPEIAQSRMELLRYRRPVDAEVKQGRLLETEADQLTTFIADRRRELFSARLWVRSRPVTSPALWRDFALALPEDFGRLKVVLNDETAQAKASARSPADITLWILSLVAGFLLLGPLRVLLNRLGEIRLAALGPHASLGPPAIAVWRVAVAGLTPLCAGLAIRAGFESTGSLTPAFDRLITLLFEAAVFASLFERAGRCVLAVRPVVFNIDPPPSRQSSSLTIYPALIGISAGFAVAISGANALLKTGPATSVASQCLIILIQLTVVASGLVKLGQTRSAEIDHLKSGSPQQDASKLPWILAVAGGWLALGGALGAILLGYIAFAGFVMRELTWVALVLAAQYLLIRFLNELVPTVLSPDRSLGRFVRVAIGVSVSGFEQIIELLAGVIRVAMLLVAWVAIIAPFGAGAEDVFGRVTSADLIIKLGQLSISPGVMAGALLIFGLGLLATRTLRGWLETRYLPKTRMDVGVRTSMASAVTYFGGLIAFVVTSAYLGMSLDRIALFASALSVGIGFGLQGVIGNFVSGLILLAERPVKVGDWIAIGDLEGDVRRISVRATEIEMGDRSKLIVPNSDLISKTVRNVTRGDAVGRVKIVLLIENSADPAVARDLLMIRLTQHPNALADPSPAVYLTDVRDGALELTAFVYVSSPRKAFNTKSDLLFQIVADLKAHNIALASSSAVITVGIPDRLIEPNIRTV